VHQVLCAYLGQLARLRDVLAKEVAVVVDERDEEKLAAQEDDSEAKVDANIIQNVERVQVSRRVSNDSVVEISMLNVRSGSTPYC
jgi:hypothetical protein